VQKLLQKTCEKLSQKIICKKKTLAKFFAKNLQKDLCKKKPLKTFKQFVVFGAIKSLPNKLFGGFQWLFLRRFFGIFFAPIV